MINEIGKKIFIFPIKLYSLVISPWLPPSCRFHQSCSSYSIEAINKHGILKGIYLSIVRILSCHSYSKKDFFDKVPKRFAWEDLIVYKRKVHKKE